MSRRPPLEPGQGDLFPVPQTFPVREARGRDRPINVLRIKTAMGEALKSHREGADVVAARIAAMTGRPLTTAALYAYTAPSREDHDMGLTRFAAFVRVTGAYHLWDLLVEDDGLTVLQGREAKLAELGLATQEHARTGQLLRQLRRELRVEPVAVSRSSRAQKR